MLVPQKRGMGLLNKQDVNQLTKWVLEWMLGFLLPTTVLACFPIPTPISFTAGVHNLIALLVGLVLNFKLHIISAFIDMMRNDDLISLKVFMTLQDVYGIAISICCARPIISCSPLYSCCSSTGRLSCKSIHVGTNGKRPCTYM